MKAPTLKTTAAVIALSIAATIGWSTWARATDRTHYKTWEPRAAYFPTGARAWNYYCESADGAKVRLVVDSANAPDLKDPNARYAFQYPQGAHTLSEQFRENRVLIECRAALGVYDVHITGVDEVVSDWRRD